MTLFEESDPLRQDEVLALREAFRVPTMLLVARLCGDWRSPASS